MRHAANHRFAFALGALALGAATLAPVLAHAQEAKGRDPEKMRQAFADRFKKADANSDGKLTKAEADAGMPRVGKNFDAIDANKDGFVTQDEIRAAMQKAQATKGSK
jgi:Ca2+-binding EF-hand superfamily protein